MGNIKNDSYICIQGFMVNELGLKGTELLVYAIIYGFSQDSSSAFTGSLSYLMQWCGAGKNTVIKALRNLTDRGLLLKTVDTVGGVRVCRYTAVSKLDMHVENVDNYREDVDNSCKCESAPDSKNEPVVQKVNQSGSKNEPGAVQKVNQGGSKSEPNNINNKLIDKLDDNINTSPCGEASSAVVTTAGAISQAEIHKEFDELWKSYPEGRKQGRKEALAAYQRTRKRGTSYEQVADGLAAYKRQIEVEQTPLKFIKQGGTWFRCEGWQDDYNTSSMAEKCLQKKQSSPALGYRQHNYDAEQLRQMGIDLGEDVYIA